jgi:hypothetical protein
LPNIMLSWIKPIVTRTTFLVERSKIHIMWVTEMASLSSVSDMLHRNPPESDTEFLAFNL